MFDITIQLRHIYEIGHDVEFHQATLMFPYPLHLLLLFRLLFMSLDIIW